MNKSLLLYLMLLSLLIVSCAIESLKRVYHSLQLTKRQRECMAITFNEYRQHDAYSLAQLVKAKDITRQELLEAAYARVEQVEPHINAINFMLPMDQVVNPNEGSFSGVPFLFKDLYLDIPSMPTSSGSKALKGYYPKKDTELVRRYLATGVTVFGKTSTPEFGLMGITEPDAFGPCCNPWDVSRSPGGSSGGSAAAVAAGVVPMASGGDGGGSLRIPASACGLFGFKPSRGRVPCGPLVGEYWQGAVQEHVLSRSVRDSAIMLDAINGSDSGAPFYMPHEKDFYQATLEMPQSLTIGLCVQTPMGGKPEKDITDTFMLFAEQLSKLGHHVEEVTLPYSGDILLEAYLGIYYGEVAADIEWAEEVLGRKLKFDELELTTWVLAKLGEKRTAKDVVQLRRKWNLLAREMGRFHRKYDLLLSPVLTQKPPRIGQLKPKPSEQVALSCFYRLGLLGLVEKTGMIDKVAEQNLQVMPYTQIANLTGQPAMSLPIWFGNELPVGAQFIAANGNDRLLFQLAGQLEQAFPWFDKHPEMDF